MDYNLKIQVNHENESSDAQALFFALGGSWRVYGTKFSYLDQPYLYLHRDVVEFGSDAEHFRCDDGAEITLEALRDLVHAKKKSENEKEMNILDEGRFVIEKEKKHSHYKKDVSGLDFVDVYRVLKLFDVTDPCVQHAVKKLLCSGQRGVKSVDKDIQEAIDSLLRYQEMKREDLK